MLLNDFFSPPDPKLSGFAGGYNSGQLGSKVTAFTTNFPDLASGAFDIAIFGVCDDRNTRGNEGCSQGADFIRSRFYALYEGSLATKIADLGNILQGNTVSDTYFAVKTVIDELVRNNIVPVILGGGQDISYAQYMGYEHLEQKVDVLAVDSHFDLDDAPEQDMEATSTSWLNKLFLHEPNFLFNFSNLGYQTYFVSQDSLRLMEKLYFDVHRLGDLSGNIPAAEPVIRNASMISFDISAIRSADACGNANATPNGLYAEEACQVCRYAGMSDKLTSIGFYEFNPAMDKNGQTAILLAQMLWYFIDGFYNRRKDIPLSPKSNYLVYRAWVSSEKPLELVFIKSKRSDRWWLQVPYPGTASKNERYHLIPCSYNDYQAAVAGDMPDLWWRTYQKLI
jgi:arginase family enzyme